LPAAAAAAFQFQSGAIESYVSHSNGLALTTFQFQSGAIESQFRPNPKRGK